MEIMYTSPNLQDLDHNLQNIITMNTPEEEEFDFDFDYDPNDLYYELSKL